MNYRYVSASVIIFIIFLLLRVFEIVDWSWWIVCLPLLIEAGLVIIIIALVIFIFRHNGKNNNAIWR